MRATSTIARGTRHIVGVGLQALLLAAIVATVALAMSAFYKPAGFIAGVDKVDAGGRLEATIGWSATASRLAADPASVQFAVTRSVPDNDPVMWVTNKCYDASGALVLWRDLPVSWGLSSNLAGEAGPFETAGVRCQAYATLRPWQSRVLGSAVMDYELGT